VFAIGGITPDDIPELLSAGVSGVAMSSAILQAQDPVAEVKRIRN
jgi:thiamine-phosphate pyrophosphorylase